MLANIDFTVRYRTNPPSPLAAVLYLLGERLCLRQSVPTAGFANANANGGNLRIKRPTRQKISNWFYTWTDSPKFRGQDVIVSISDRDHSKNASLEFHYI
jgi:hypothetical protein